MSFAGPVLSVFTGAPDGPSPFPPNLGIAKKRHLRLVRVRVDQDLIGEGANDVAPIVV